MSRLILKTGRLGAALDERGKRALICAVLSYALFLLIVIMSFMPARKPIAITVGVHGRPSAVRWSGSGQAKGGRRESGGQGAGRRGHAKGRVSKNLAASKVAEPVVAPVVGQKPLSKRQKRRAERLARKKRLQEAKSAELERKKVSKKKEPVLKVAKEPVKESVKEPVKELAKKVVVPDPVPEPVYKPVQKPEPEPVVVPEKQVQQVQAVEPVADLVEIGVHADQDFENTGDEPVGDEATRGEVTRDEYALMCAVGRAWRPPHGLKQGLSARLVVSISAQGRVENVEIVSSSQVPAYDIAARGSLYRAEYPPVFWGKNIAIVFGQNE